MLKENTHQRPSADKTRREILSAAQHLFAEKGFAATSISEIARRAKANQSLIYHHFGSKQALWHSAKRALLEKYIDLDDSGSYDDLNLRDFLDAFIARRFQFYDENPEVVRIVSWQRLEPNRTQLQGTANHPEVRARWIKKIKQLQVRGEIKQELDPELTIIMLMNAANGFFFDTHAIVANAAPDEQKALKKQYLEMLLSTLLYGLSPNVCQ